MPIKVTCPKCQGVLHAPDDAGGKRGKCPTCGTVLAIPSDSPRVSGAIPGPSSDDGDMPRPAAGFGVGRPASPEPSEMPPPRPGGFGSAGAMPSAAPPRPGPGPSRPLPPTPAPTGQGGPFAKTGKGPAPVGQDPEAAQRLAMAWKRARRGLLWVQFAGFLFLISFLGSWGLAIAQQQGVKLPDKSPGYLGQRDLNSTLEIKYAVAFIPLSLGVLLLTLGRYGFNNIPRSSYAKGMALLAATSTLLAFIGYVLFLFPTAGAIYGGLPFTQYPRDLLHADELNGILQRIGFGMLVVFGLLAELYFHSSFGRMASYLGNDKLSRRGTFRAFLYGFFIVCGIAWILANNDYSKDISKLVKEYFTPQWDKLGNNQLTVLFSLYALAGLVVWFLYTRLVGAARGAITEWLEQNDPNP